MNNNLVSVLILNWNRKTDTARAIKSVNLQSYKNIEIVLVDNGSDDGSVEYLRQLFPDLNIIKLEKNYGCPGGRNRGISHCRGEFIFFLDNDGILDRNAILNAMNTINSNHNIAVVTGLVKIFNNEEEIDRNLKFQKNTLKEVSLFNGGASLHRKEIFKTVGTYPEDYNYGGEETFLALKIMDSGYKIIFNEQVVLWHKKSDLSRFKDKELLQSWSNTLMTAYQLFPLEFFLAYLAYFVLVYPFYAYKAGLFLPFMKSLITSLKRFRGYIRKPVKRNTYWKFRSNMNYQNFKKVKIL